MEKRKEKDMRVDQLFQQLNSRSSLPSGFSLDNGTNKFRYETVKSFLGAGVPLQKAQKMRKYLEDISGRRSTEKLGCFLFFSSK